MRGMRTPFLMGREKGGGVRWVIPCEKGIHGPSHEFCQEKVPHSQTALRKRSICFPVREKFVLFMGFSS